MDHAGIWDCRRHQSHRNEVVGEFVGHSLGARPRTGEELEVFTANLKQPLRINAFPFRLVRVTSVLEPKMEFSSAGNVGMARYNLLDKSRARARHPDDQNRHLGFETLRLNFPHEFRRNILDSKIKRIDQLASIPAAASKPMRRGHL